MKKRKNTILLALLLILTIALSCVGCTASSVQAASQMTKLSTVSGYASSNDGNASIILTPNDGQSLIGKVFHVYQLFYAENSQDGTSINYTFYEDSKLALQQVVSTKIGKTASEVTEYEVIDYIQSLNTDISESYYSDFRYFVEDLRDSLNNLGISAKYEMTVMDMKADGTIQLDGLAYGYYIVDEVTATEETHSASSLCMVNTANPQTTLRLKSDYPKMEKQIQEDDSKELIGNNGWGKIADYEIGQTIPFKITSDAPNMNGYSSYYYAWHDVMDDAITFNRDSVTITVSDETNEYTLLDTEYTLTEGKDGETFVIEIYDLKSIIDIHFNKMNELGHNTYGQKIQLSYQGMLNELAAEDTGKPGYENKARLEFSNDPDSDGNGKTGNTPWDTVVCFTYQLNGLKKNEHEELLEGAKFCLYRDEACEDAFTTEEIISDENGVFKFTGLDSGIYYLKETQAPDGYRLLIDPIKIEITSVLDDTQKELSELHITADVKSFYDGLLNENTIELDVNMDEGAGNLTVINRAGATLPVTGSAATLLLLGTGISSVFVSFIIAKRKKQTLS